MAEGGITERELEELRRARAEALREVLIQAIESSKHLTTLNAGSIVVIGTFLQDIFPTKHGTLAVSPFLKFLIASSFVSFGVSLAIATVVMVVFSRATLNLVPPPSGEHREPRTIRYEGLTGEVRYQFSGLVFFLSDYATLLPLPFFTVGLLCFGIAVILNLYS